MQRMNENLHSTSCLITLITALSISATATNGEVKGGGTYYIISRKLSKPISKAMDSALLNPIRLSLTSV